MILTFRYIRLGFSERIGVTCRCVSPSVGSFQFAMRWPDELRSSLGTLLAVSSLPEKTIALQRKSVSRAYVVERELWVRWLAGSRRWLATALATVWMGAGAVSPVFGNPAALERQGRLIQISGTGKSIDGAWGIWQRQVAVDVLWLARHLEMELRSGDDPFQQTLQWRDRAPVTVAAFWTRGGQQRFVAIAPLTEAWGWQFEVQGDRLFLHVPSAPTTAALPASPSPSPSPTYPVIFPRPLDLAWLPGVRVQQRTEFFNERPVSVAIVALDFSQPSLSLRPFWAVPERLEGIRDTRSAAQIQGAAVAINGGFFNRNTKHPLGALRREGEWISSPILGRGVVAWNDAGEFVFARLSFRETAAIAAREFAIPYLNSGFVQAGWARYSPAWGDRYTTQTDGEAIVTVQAGAISKIQAAEAAGSVSAVIPDDGYLLVARQTTARERALSLQVGEIATLTAQLDPPVLADYPHAMGGGPLLLKDGWIVLDAELEQFQPSFRTQRAARSAIGRMADGRILLVTAGKGKEFAGITLGDMAILMQRLGCEDALNLDGGTSSTLTVGGDVANFIGSPPRVHNYLGAFFGE